MTRIAVFALALAACGPKTAPSSPVDPAPTEPTPAEPMPVEPTPAEPAPTAPVAASRTPATSFELDGNRLQVPAPVLFATGSADIDPSSEPALWHVVDYLTAKEYITTLRIEVHTSSDTPGGQRLTEQRALAVAAWLTAHGVACERLLPVGFGDSKPVASNADVEGRAANRRVEFQNAALRGRPIGGMPTDGGGRVAGDPCAH